MIYYGMVNTTNSSAYTFPALQSFFRHTRLGEADRFFLFDNNNDLELPSAFERVEIVRNPEPRSFAANVNQVIRPAAETGADVIFPNNDVIFTEGWLEPLLQRDDAILLPLCNQFKLYEHGALHLAPAMDLAEYLGKGADLDAIVATHKKSVEIDFINTMHMSFFCFRIPRRVYQEIGLFDENYGRGGAEDVDYRVRAHLAGFDVMMAAKSYLLHFQGKSTWRGGETPEQTQARNEAYIGHFCRKWGTDLARIFLFFPDWQKSAVDMGVAEDLEKGDFGRAVRRILARRS